MTQTFIGRENELNTLNINLNNRDSASFAVMNGRRRIGKSRLIEEFAKRHNKFYKFTGLAPRPNMTAQEQRDEFMRKFREQFELPISGIQDWGDLFTLLAKQTRRGRVVILFDEISWMAYGDPDFLGKLKNVWEDYFSKNPKLILFLCDSVSSWIENNLLSSTAFMGRPTLHMHLENLVLNNHKLIIKNLGISEEDIIFDNPYFQRKTNRVPGCQVDYMIQTRHDTVYIFEIKFYRGEIGSSIIEEVKEKISRLSLPKPISKRIILVHANGVKENVEDSLFFTKLINFSDLLVGNN